MIVFKNRYFFRTYSKKWLFVHQLINGNQLTYAYAKPVQQQSSTNEPQMVQHVVQQGIQQGVKEESPYDSASSHQQAGGSYYIQHQPDSQ